jgi:hypothetical protein
MPRTLHLILAAVCSVPAPLVACGGSEATVGTTCRSGMGAGNGESRTAQCMPTESNDAAYDSTGAEQSDGASTADAIEATADRSTVADAESADDMAAKPCPFGRGPDMVSALAPDGTLFCVDTTEVTVTQYGQFLSAKGSDTSGQRPVCSFNHTFIPVGACAAGTPPDSPITCINWCDADAFCTWAGKRLCGSYQGGAQPAEAYPSASAWYLSCNDGDPTADGGISDSPLASSCNTSPNPAPVRSFPNCHGHSSPWDQVYDLIGNAAEFIDYSDAPGLGACPPSSFGCALAVGGGWGAAHDHAGCIEPQGIQVVGIDFATQSIGFRCCATP